jgi:hypothetical protein
VPSVPEPATFWLLSIGLIAFGTAMRARPRTHSKAAPTTLPRNEQQFKPKNVVRQCLLFQRSASSTLTRSSTLQSPDQRT